MQMDFRFIFQDLDLQKGCQYCDSIGEYLKCGRSQTLDISAISLNVVTVGMGVWLWMK
jgi:hypothetical protein